MNLFKIILSGILFLTIVSTGNAQTEKGKILVGGDINLNLLFGNDKLEIDNNNINEDNIISFEFSPQVGFFVIDGLAIGAALPLSYTSETDEDDDKFNVTSISISPFLRYYFGSNIIKPYLHGQAGLGTLNFNGEVGAQTIDDSSGIFTYNVGGGLGVFFNEYISLDIGLGYTSTSINQNNDNNAEIKSITNRFGLNMGIVVFL